MSIEIYQNREIVPTAYDHGDDSEFYVRYTDPDTGIDLSEDHCPRFSTVEEARAAMDAVAADEAAKKALEAAELAERKAWAETHGSLRLRRMLAEGIECEAVYLDERLVLGVIYEISDADVAALDAAEGYRDQTIQVQILNGARHWGLPEKYIEQLKGIRVAPGIDDAAI